MTMTIRDDTYRPIDGRPVEVQEGTPLFRANGSARVIVALLSPFERAIVAARVDTAQVIIVYVETLGALRAAVLDGGVALVLVSASCVTERNLPGLQLIKRAAPGVTVALVVTEKGSQSSFEVSTLADVAFVVDLRDSAGWRTLRSVLDPTSLPSPFACAVAEAIHRSLGRMTDGWARLLKTLFDPEVVSVQKAAQRVHIPPSVLALRFRRADLPPPREYLDWARLVLIAQAAECSTLSMATIAGQVGASSAQAMHRKIERLMRMRFAEFRRLYKEDAALTLFCERLIEPYRAILRWFDPTVPDRRRPRTTLPVASPRVAAGECGTSRTGETTQASGTTRLSLRALRSRRAFCASLTS